jgi:membrane protease YdiL (CAAX protease family)
MWIAPVAVIATALMRGIGTDYGHFTAGTVAMIFLSGLFIGFAEELLTRGIAVNLLRRHGYSERVVMVLSALIFAMLHLSNLLGGMSIQTVLATVGMTFFYGIMMYLTMRVTGRIVWAMLRHAITDPTTMLASGGIDATTVHVSPLAAFAGNAPVFYLVFGIIAIIAVRGRVHMAVPVNRLQVAVAA